MPASASTTVPSSSGRRAIRCRQNSSRLPRTLIGRSWRFNAGFERSIFAHVLAPRYGWPDIPLERFFCLQASALALSLPGKLEKVAAALGLAEQKDAEGAALMKRMSRPRRPRPGEDPTKLYWHDDDAESLERLYRYCFRDVEVSRAVFNKIGLLPEPEQKVWELDQRTNDRGIKIDRKLCEGAVKVAAAASAAIDGEIKELTGGEVASARQVAKLLGWLAAQGVTVGSAQIEDVERALERGDLAPTVRRVLECRRDGAHAAAAKYQRMLEQIGAGDRVRGAFRYHGASTGRWSAIGVQPQNMKKPPRDVDLPKVIELVATGDYEAIGAIIPRRSAWWAEWCARPSPQRRDIS